MSIHASNRPQRLYFKSYLAFVRSSVGSNAYRNFYVRLPSGEEIDAFADGQNSCAFFVSSVLTIFKKIDGIHGTVDRTVEEMLKFGWRPTGSPKTGDVLIWEAIELKDGWHKHIGFYVGSGMAISTSTKNRSPQQHNYRYDEQKRKIEQILTMPDWE